MTSLPYGLLPEHFEQAVRQAEAFFNRFSNNESEFPQLLEILAKNAISGLVSDLMIYGLSKAQAELCKNIMIGGFPDLVPRSEFPAQSVLKGHTGIEVKSSKNNSWQGHNAEDGWLMAVKYITRPETFDIRIEKIYLAELTKEDWTFFPRKENSRRTPTATINKSGLKKLRAQVVYHNGD